MARHTPSRLYPPVWVMLTLSTLATLTLGVGLAIFHYQQQSKVILSTGETLFNKTCYAFISRPSRRLICSL